MRFDSVKMLVLPGRNGNAYSASARTWKAIDPPLAYDFRYGGVIVLPESVQPERKVKEWTEHMFRLMTPIPDAGELPGAFTCKCFTGAPKDGYKYRQGELFGKKSVCVVLVGMEDNTVAQTAKKLAREFDVREVMVKSLSTGELWLIRSK